MPRNAMLCNAKSALTPFIIDSFFHPPSSTSFPHTPFHLPPSTPLPFPMLAIISHIKNLIKISICISFIRNFISLFCLMIFIIIHQYQYQPIPHLVISFVESPALHVENSVIPKFGIQFRSVREYDVDIAFNP